MRFSFVIFGLSCRHSTALAERAEQLGFDAVWFGDHVVSPRVVESAYPYSESGDAGYTADTPLTDVWVSIAHASAVTRTIGLGPNVLLLPLRHPAVVAQAAVSAQDASEGRLRLGVGAGWLEEEFSALGVDFSSRGRRLDEALAVLRGLCTGDWFSYDGEFFSFPDVKLGTCASAPIPISVGGSSAPALRRAARCEGWNGAEQSLEQSISHRDQLLELRAAEDADQDFRIYAKPLTAEPDVLRSYQEAGFQDLVVPLRELYNGEAVSLAQQLAALERLAEQIMVVDLV